MVFSSNFFIFYFLPIFIILYYIIQDRYKNLFLLLASILFYAWGAQKFVFIILGTTVVNYILVRLMDHSEKKLTRKLLAAGAIGLNLSLLIYYKYFNFLLDNINLLSGLFEGPQMEWQKIILPIGISFYTFQSITYVVDVYRQEHAPLKKIVDYMMYILSFPQMLAGPIVRYTSIADQITDRECTSANVLNGFYRFALGLGKKVIIANAMGEQADLIMNANLNTIGIESAWIAALAYTFQIYYDFSGYSDMAIGIGKMMGFTFPENFNSPNIARNMTEFWKRWHMTLGAFMRNYLYIPLGGNRVSKPRLYFNLWVVFLISGFWHGSSWNFVLWGAYNGLFLVLDRLFLARFTKWAGMLPSILMTFTIVMFGRVIFRMEDFGLMKKFIGIMFSPSTSLGYAELTNSFLPILALAVLFGFWNLIPGGQKVEDFFYKKNDYNLKESLFLTSASMVLLVISVSSLTASGFNPFIYFRF